MYFSPSFVLIMFFKCVRLNFSQLILLRECFVLCLLSLGLLRLNNYSGIRNFKTKQKFEAVLNYKIFLFSIIGCTKKIQVIKRKNSKSQDFNNNLTFRTYIYLHDCKYSKRYSLNPSYYFNKITFVSSTVLIYFIFTPL